jgi:hypothetical protein
MAVAGKRLFWTSIIIVELVLVYLLWKPYRERVKPVHRAALAPAAVVHTPEVKAAAPIVVPSRKPWSGVQHSVAAAHRKPPVVNAALKAPEPIPTKVTTQTPTLVTPMDSFWCRISTNVEAKCDCKSNGEEQASNLVMRSGTH